MKEDLQEPTEKELKEIEENGTDGFGKEIPTTKEAEEIVGVIFGAER